MVTLEARTIHVLPPHARFPGQAGVTGAALAPGTNGFGTALYPVMNQSGTKLWARTVGSRQQRTPGRDSRHGWLNSLWRRSFWPSSPNLPLRALGSLPVTLWMFLMFPAGPAFLLVSKK